MRLDDGFEVRPRDQLVHSAQELLLAGLAALVAELAVRVCRLLIHLCVLNRVQQPLSHEVDLFAASLNIRSFPKEVGKKVSQEISQEASNASSDPLCPRCGSAMVIRETMRGANAGQQFWRCSTFPKCRGLQLKEN